MPSSKNSSTPSLLFTKSISAIDKATVPKTIKCHKTDSSSKYEENNKKLDVNANLHWNKSSSTT